MLQHGCLLNVLDVILPASGNSIPAMFLCKEPQHSSFPDWTPTLSGLRLELSVACAFVPSSPSIAPSNKIRVKSRPSRGPSAFQPVVDLLDAPAHTSPLL
ncbi:hypothetical protein J1614_001199 [Plenodomus biglobosus]|nr:hypothetical protein J1614_001199 [Plenodomus biglobosus]